jgi:hypothetical protein
MTPDRQPRSASLALALACAALDACHLVAPIPGEPADADADADKDADGDGDADGDAGGDADADGGTGCPADMVRRESDGSPFCIDRYEASRGDGDAAVSHADLTPWTRSSYGGAEAACELADKRLCRTDEWESACLGPNGYPFFYGASVRDRVCNFDDTLTPDLDRAGSFPDCTFGGLYDMLGNASEIVVDGDYYSLRGGDYTKSRADWTCRYFIDPGEFAQESIGFRCCSEPL